MRWLAGHHQLKGRESEQTLGDSGGQRRLACCSPWGHRVGQLRTTTKTSPSSQQLKQVLNLGCLDKEERIG